MEGYSEVLVQEMIDRGFVIPNGDGTYQLTPDAEKYIRAKIKADPTLFAQLFPERLL